jgi:DNA-binding YbaB/EbfC family protein
MVRRAAELQAELARRRAELEERTFEGTSGGGVVRAVMRGDGRLEAIHIDPAVLDPDDAGMVEDLVVAAVAQAHEAVQQAAGDAFGAPGDLPGDAGLGDLGLDDLGPLLG